MPLVDANEIPIIGCSNRIYLGGYTAGKDVIWLESHNIKYILNTANECHFRYDDMEDVTYKKISMEDSPLQNIRQYFDECHQFIDMAFKNNSNIFIHCYAGISRSSTIVISYLMLKLKMKYDEAITYVKNIRSIVNPNNSFKQQLLQYENNLFNSKQYPDDYLNKNYKSYKKDY